MTKKIFLIDNYDSFTYNLFQLVASMGNDVIVSRNDKITISEIEKLKPNCIIISPGPGRPENAGISVELIKYFKDKIPILGICLGHQAIGYAFGANIVKSGSVFHGKTSKIYHNGHSIFKSIDSPFIATRYHSLIIDKNSLPDQLQLIAWTEDGVIMGIAHVKYPIIGLQFHPESILTEVGKIIITNFINMF